MIRSLYQLNSIEKLNGYTTSENDLQTCDELAFENFYNKCPNYMNEIFNSENREMNSRNNHLKYDQLLEKELQDENGFLTLDLLSGMNF